MWCIHKPENRKKGQNIGKKQEESKSKVQKEYKYRDYQALLRILADESDSSNSDCDEKGHSK